MALTCHLEVYIYIHIWFWFGCLIQACVCCVWGLDVESVVWTVDVGPGVWIFDAMCHFHIGWLIVRGVLPHEQVYKWWHMEHRTGWPIDFSQKISNLLHHHMPPAGYVTITVSLRMRPWMGRNQQIRVQHGPTIKGMLHPTCPILQGAKTLTTRYSLFFFLHGFCAYDVDAERRTNADRVYVTKLLTDKALEEADNSDKIIPLEIAGIAEFSGKGGWIHPLISKPTKGGNLRVRIYVSHCLGRWWNLVDVSTSLRRGFRSFFFAQPLECSMVETLEKLQGAT